MSLRLVIGGPHDGMRVDVKDDLMHIRLAVLTPIDWNSIQRTINSVDIKYHEYRRFQLMCHDGGPRTMYVDHKLRDYEVMDMLLTGYRNE